jgi:hypothetical protein
MQPGQLLALPGGGYVYLPADEGVRIEVRHLRRQYHQLHGEFDVRVEWADAPTCHGSLTCADLNLSSQRERSARADYCAGRLKHSGFDWRGAIDAACQLVIQAERQTSDAIVLDDAPDERPPADFEIYGLSIPADSHSQIITDGGGLKSLILLLVLGTLARRGVPSALLDWEWNAPRHLARKHRLFGAERLPELYYLRCRNPITVEQDHIRRFCETHHIAFIGIDSVSAAVDGKLADDDVARAYNRALDGFPPSLAAAHVPKSTTDPQAESKAFGSAFFHNYARCTWSLKKQVGANDDLVTVVLTPQKQNDGGRRNPVALEFTFDAAHIGVRNVDPGAVEAYVDGLPLKDRITRLLAGGAMTIASIAEALDAKPDSVGKAIKRELGQRFIKVVQSDGIDRYALLERWAA